MARWLARGAGIAAVLATLGAAACTAAAAVRIETLVPSGSLNFPQGVSALRPSSTTWSPSFVIADTSDCVVKRVTPQSSNQKTGPITTVAGAGCAAGNTPPFAAPGIDPLQASINQPCCVASTPDGGYLVADSFRGMLDKWDAVANKLVTVAGSGDMAHCISTQPADGSPALSANLCQIVGLAAHPTDPSKFLVVGSSGVWEVSGTTIHRVAPAGSNPVGVVYWPDGTHILVTDFGNESAGSAVVTEYSTADPTHTGTVRAGGGVADPGDGGQATAAALMPVSVARAFDGGFFVGEITTAFGGHCRIRHVDTNGVITTVGGTGTCGTGGADGIFATDATFGDLYGMDMYPSGLLVAETSGTVRLLDRISIVNPPPPVVGPQSPKIEWDSLDGSASAADCFISAPDGSVDLPCTSPETVGGSDGPWGFNVSETNVPGTVGGAFNVFSAASWFQDLTPPQPFGLIAPADGATGLPPAPTFSWAAAADTYTDQNTNGQVPGSGIDHYELWIDGVKDHNVPGDTTQATASAPLSEGTHTWLIRAVDRAGNSRDSATRPLSSSSPPTASFSVSPNPSLIGRPVTFDASASSDANGPIAKYEWDLDGDGSYETDGGTVATTSRSYDSPGTFNVSLRVTDGVGLTATATQELHITTPEAIGANQVGVTINNGAQYTRTPDVTIGLRYPPTTTSLLVSNDGGFLAPLPFAPSPQISWRLDSSGPERLPKIVYVRFLNGPIASNNFTDDIILDEIPPVVEKAQVSPSTPTPAGRAAKLRKWVVTLKASDSNSGVGKVQVTANKKKPGRLLDYKRKLAVKAPARPKYIRAVDRAGNVSRWKTAR